MTTWVDLEDITLSEIDQRKMKAARYHLRVEPKQAKLTATAHALVVSKGGGRGDRGGMWVKGYKLLVIR